MHLFTDLLNSKKARMTVIGAVLVTLVRVLDLDPANVQIIAEAVGGAAGEVGEVAGQTAQSGSGKTDLSSLIALLFATFIGGQGIADAGKEKAKVENGGQHR